MNPHQQNPQQPIRIRNERVQPSSLPKPVVKKSPLRFLIWIVPLLAIAAAAVYVREYVLTRGKVIVVKFSDVSGLKAGDSPVEYRGVSIGQVDDIALAKDHRHAEVKVRLNQDAQAFAQGGAVYWIVRPQASAAGVTGLSTMFSGPYISATPGSGAIEKEVNGLEENPIDSGLSLILHAPNLDHVTERAPIYYRGVQVGEVRDMRLGHLGDRVDIRVVIWDRYRALIRQNTRFWALTGFDVEGGIFSGIQLKMDSLRTLISGGFEFATPEGKDMGGPVRAGADFTVEEQPDKAWKKWAPRIPISPAVTRPAARDQDTTTGQES